MDQDILSRLDRLAERLDDLVQHQKVVERLLTGNGRPADGLVVRVDRLEQKATLIWAALVAAVASMASTVWEWITRGHP